MILEVEQRGLSAHHRPDVPFSSCSMLENEEHFKIGIAVVMAIFRECNDVLHGLFSD